MDLYINKDECCGCGSCINICNTDSISFENDSKGFFYPKIDNDTCINCGLCIKVCPLKFKQQDKLSYNQKFYALKNIDDYVRKESSSGGFFFELSKYVINNGGYVFGVIFNEQFNAIHYGTNKLEEIEKFRTSKYIQSDTLNTYKTVRKLLNEDKLVLYSGTPCQIYGLKKFLLNKTYKKLITIDNICHGVPSNGIFLEYKNKLENKYESRIKKMNFRFKTSKNTQNIKVDFTNGKEYFKTNADDPFYRLFQCDYILRESCYTCKFSNINRISDITIGDFWDFQEVLKDFDDKKGVSLIIVNTFMGKKIFDSIKDSFYLKKFEMNDCMQPNLKYSTNKPEDYYKFWNDYDINGFEFVIKHYPNYSIYIKLKKMIKKILILTSLYSEK
ncbi:Coenzyme F420 hydrogenase/dehydrogenase, beta subunit C-terminal domain [Clostridium butyricum]|uniref:Coenzyme F420 hydrogenase/dehydrogenase, beta subunit C-terminal domain n=1 Tax=Clostridium butyricum TaxID=1492 RepID=UPI0005EBCD4E|nr:Coenzyme F420 hydrogenase/dehydrogenase, beta subunit C-terminal domain [Clostridium butyricum]MZI81735.1 4Fe-4S dicluster domain-containing protein [Clostridium butyricum]